MQFGDRHIVRPRPNYTHLEEHIFEDGTHEVEVYGLDPNDPKRVFLHCLTHGNSNWVSTDMLIIETEEVEVGPMKSFEVLFTNFNHKTDTETHMDLFVSKDAQATSAMELVNRFPEIRSVYLIIKDIETGKVMVWDRVDNCERTITRQLMVTKVPFRIAFTGHRPQFLAPKNQAFRMDHPIRVWIRNQIRAELLTQQANYGDIEVIVGGALGVDTDAVIVARELGIPYHFFAPCHEQHNKWPRDSQLMWIDHWNNAATRRYIHEGTYPGAWVMQRRNEAMVDFSNLVISFWNGTAGGTANCITYARTKGIEVLNFNPTEADLSGIPKRSPQAQPTERKAVAFFDGACRGNPGPGTAGVLLVDENDNIIDEHGFKLPHQTTNNVAEWHGLVAALRLAQQHGVTHLQVRGDSELVIKQMRGEYRVKDEKFLELYHEALDLATYFRTCVFVHVPREQNPADATANAAF